MSSRTAHSFGGMRRYMQMSRTRVFIFVEGRCLDPEVYGRVCSPVCTETQKTYEIVIADRIAGGGGGKNILTRYFEYLRDYASLIDRSQGESKLAMFYMDKDVDDIFGTMRLSEHVVYTPHYEIENHLFQEGDLVSAIATAGSLDPQLVAPRITDKIAWLKQAAQSWVDWVLLCLLARELALKVPASYSLPHSRVHTSAGSATDAAALQAYLTEMEGRSGLDSAKFHRKVGAVRRLVNRVYARSSHEKIFRGKWFSAFALYELDSLSGGVPYNRNGAEDRLIGSLMSTVNFDAGWVEHFRSPLRNTLSAM